MLEDGASAPRPMMLHVEYELEDNPSFYTGEGRILKRGGGSSGGGFGSSRSSSFGRSYGNCYGDRCSTSGTDATSIAIIVGSICGICCVGVGIYSLCLCCIKRRKLQV